MSDDLFRATLATLRDQIPPDVLTRLREAHEGHWGCAAWSEGQECCLADLLVDPVTEGATA